MWWAATMVAAAAAVGQAIASGGAAAECDDSELRQHPAPQQQPDCQAPTTGVTDTLLCRTGPQATYTRVPWLGQWAWSEQGQKTHLAMRSEIKGGQVSRVHNALSPVVAEALFNELAHASVNWTRQLNTDASDSVRFSRHVLHCTLDGAEQHAGGWSLGDGTVENTCPLLLLHFHRYLNDNSRWWSQFTEPAVHSWSSFTEGPQATWYRENDYLSRHNDRSGHHNKRALAFTLSLAKHFQPRFGGSFRWEANSSNVTQYNPEFNTLLLFVPASSSWHAVSAVTNDLRTRAEGEAEGIGTRRRMAISGWFLSS